MSSPADFLVLSGVLQSENCWASALGNSDVSLRMYFALLSLLGFPVS